MESCWHSCNYRKVSFNSSHWFCISLPFRIQRYFLFYSEACNWTRNSESDSEYLRLNIRHSCSCLENEEVVSNSLNRSFGSSIPLRQFHQFHGWFNSANSLVAFNAINTMSISFIVYIMTSHWQEWRDRLWVKLENFYNYCVFHFECSNLHYVVIISLHISLTIISIQISFHPGAMFPGRASWVMGVCLCQAMARSQQIIQDFGHLKTYDLIIFSKWFSGKKPGSNSKSLSQTTPLNAVTALSAMYVYITIVLLRRIIK